MVILEVYRKNIKVKYKSTILSKATFVHIVCGIFTITLPFLIAYKSGGFWLKQDTFNEQPSIQFKGRYLLVATTNNLSSPITCSTFPFYEKTLNFLDACSKIKVREVDVNYDGKVDKFTLSLSINLEDNKKISGFTLIVPIDYKLTICPLQMEAAIIYQQFLQQPMISELEIISDLKTFQANPIHCKRKHIYNNYNTEIIVNEKDINSYNVENIIASYLDRKISTHLTNVYTSFKMKSTNKFTINLTVRNPEVKIYYKPGFWQIIKWAWIQYFAVYIIISWIVTKIKKYIFDNRLVLFYKDTPIKKLK